MSKLLFFFLLFFFLPQTAFAGEVVINEFLVDPDSEQWVELYNKGSGSVDIGGWFIDDSGGTQKFTIPTGTTIGPLEFKVFESGFFNLNRTSADTAQLLNGTTLEDSYSYNSGPGVNSTYGRQTDGGSDWVVFNSPTKGSSNNTSQPAPTSTPTPSPTFTPTPTTKPTLTQKPTSTPKPTPTTKPASSAVQSQGTSSNPSTKPVSLGFSSPVKSPATSKSTLGEKITATPSSTKVPTPTKKPEVKTLASSQNNLPKVLIALGIIFLAACGILAFRLYKKKESNE